MKIGVFDSGLGGLTILKAIVKELPQYDYEFFGDTANLPYGDKDEEEIYQLTKKAVTELFKKDCLLIIIACNTASAETLRRLQTEFLPKNFPNRRILGVIIPTLEELVEQGIKSSFLIGTNRTINSKKYSLEIAKRGLDIKLNPIATPRLVPLIENGQMVEASAIIKEILNQPHHEEAIILGCTHYTILQKDLSETAQKNHCRIIAQDLIIPKKLKTYLDNHPEIASRLSQNTTRNIFLSKHNPHYDQLLAELLQERFV